MTKILVVEDSSVDRILVGGLLGKELGWNIQFANDGREALRKIESTGEDVFYPDVIVTDLQMPNMNGLELVGHIRDFHSKIPVVLITSLGSEEIAIKALRAGATSFTPKSMIKGDLVRTVKQVLEMAGRMQYARDNSSLPAPKQIAFVLENDSSLIGATIEHLQSNLPSWSDKDRLQIGMAMDEALVNAMHHGNLEVDSQLRETENEASYYELIRIRKSESPFCHRRVRVQAEFSDQHISVQISDDGKGFNPELIPDPTSDENLHNISGRGLYLIRSFMDSVDHNEAGNQITMKKLREAS
ncbi:MAG: ATP-binding protein [Mariniblastus sp.]|nr:ATP-binding protein [Mariniblastus sp.]